MIHVKTLSPGLLPGLLKDRWMVAGIIVTALGLSQSASAACDQKTFFGKLSGFLSRSEKNEPAVQPPVKDHVPMKIANSASAQGLVIDPELKSLGVMPRGSAVATSAGALEEQGIRQIIHAASGSMMRSGPKFDPSLDGVVHSVKNSLELARLNGHQRVAVPFIGGKIFIDRIGIPAQELANQIVEAALQARGGLELRFVTFGEEDTNLFKRALQRYASQLPPDAAQVTPGSITDFKVHGASAIINAANMEVVFGGGISGAIGRATGQPEEINREAQSAIRAFYQSH